jgi:phytanoyl-CoA hydroxylase
LKPPRHGTAKPWHQDDFFFQCQPADGVVTTWIPLDDADEENGCLVYANGSHRRGPIPHVQVPARTWEWGADPGRVDESDAVAVPLRAGGVALHHSMTLHRTGANPTDRPRRALSTTWVAVDRAVRGRLVDRAYPCALGGRPSRGMPCVARFDERGWLLLDGAASPALIELADTVRARIARAPVEHRLTAPFIAYSPSVIDGSMRPFAIDAFLDDTQADPRALLSPTLHATVLEILGGEPQLLCERIACKGPGAMQVGAHQDATWFAWASFTSQSVAVIVALDDADETNGCFEVARERVRTQIGPIGRKDLPATLLYEPIKMRRGDVLLIDGFQPYRSGENRSTRHGGAVILGVHPWSDGAQRNRYQSLLPRLARRALLEDLGLQFGLTRGERT